MSGLVFDSFGEWLDGVVQRACQQALEQLTSALESSTAVSFDSGWWVQPESQALVQSVLLLAAALMVGCLLLAALQGLMAGDVATPLRSLLMEAPFSVLGIMLLTAVAGALLKFADAASALVLGDGAGAAGQLLLSLANPVAFDGPIAGLLLGLTAVATVLVWVELVVRESLIYLLVAFAPLLLAARVWPAARPAWRKSVEIGLALIFSKLAIALALALGAAAMSGNPPGELDLSGLLAGAALMGTAAFTPFALLRLLPVVEGAVAGQGISRAPARGLMTGMQAGYYAAGLRRLAGGGMPPALAGTTGAGGTAGGHAALGPGGPDDDGSSGGSAVARRPSVLPEPVPSGNASAGDGGASSGRQLPPGPRRLGPGPRGLGPGPRGIGPGPRGIGPGPQGLGPGPQGLGPGPRGIGPGPQPPGPGGSGGEDPDAEASVDGEATTAPSPGPPPTVATPSSAPAGGMARAADVAGAPPLTALPNRASVVPRSARRSAPRRVIPLGVPPSAPLPLPSRPSAGQEQL